MTQHKLPQHQFHDSWSFKFDSSKRRFGVCKYRTRTISMSKVLCKMNDEPAVKDTILHEIAHALVGTGHHHDSSWRKLALEIGCNGKTCCEDSVVVPPSTFIGTCPNGHTFERFRRTRGQSSCNKCAGNRFNSKFLITWKRR